MPSHPRTPPSDWINQGLQAVATGGPDAVRVEAIAKSLGVTKGGFYGYFGDRDALLQAILDAWEQASVDDVLARVEDEGGEIGARMRRAGALTFSGRLLLVDLAVRDWARRDCAVAERLRRVDNQRMEYLRAGFSTICDDPADVEARSLLAFSAAIANHLIGVDHGALSRAEVLGRAADILERR